MSDEAVREAEWAGGGEAAWGAGTAAERQARSLKNYGACWYGVRVPAAVQREQLRCLTRSRLAGELTAGQKIRLVARGLARWGGLKRRADDLAAPRPPAFCNVVRDFAMFAAGYGELRALWGEGRARARYGEMFLATGDMEMAWLWPPPSDFAAAPDPIATLIAYWGAYLGAYRDLGIYEFEPPRHAAGGDIVTAVRASVFRELLERFDCPELGGLVHEMERRALDAALAPLGRAARLEPEGPGAQTFVIEPRAARAKPDAGEKRAHAPVGT